MSISEDSPKPAHLGQAPKGLLKLKSLGSANGMLSSQDVQSSSEENRRTSKGLLSISVVWVLDAWAELWAAASAVDWSMRSRKTVT